MSEIWSVPAGAPAPAARQRLLVCLDLQQAGLAGRDSADRCIVNCRRVLGHAREQGWRIVHVHTKRACPAEARPIEGLEPLTVEPVVYRSGVSAFSSRAFRQMVAGPACELVIIGYSMSSSCLATALVAYDEDLPVTMVEDAVSAAPMDPATRAAMDLVTRHIAGPFVKLTSTQALVGRAPLLRVVPA
ncbi:MAG TPA: isochorismatase family protein [Caulobacteraceae bacterium]